MFFRHQGCFLCAIWHLAIPNTFLEFFCSNCWNFSVPILSLVRSPSRGLSCLRGLFCPCWQRDFLAYFRLSGLLGLSLAGTYRRTTLDSCLAALRLSWDASASLRLACFLFAPARMTFVSPSKLPCTSTVKGSNYFAYCCLTIVGRLLNLLLPRLLWASLRLVSS
jgi:hypothetical protein